MIRAEREIIPHKADVPRNGNGNGKKPIKIFNASTYIEYGRIAEEIDPYQLYLAEISKIPLLTPQEEKNIGVLIYNGNAAKKTFLNANLAKAKAELEDNDKKFELEDACALNRIITEGEKAQKKLVNSNLLWVVRCARKYKMSKLAPLDLIQEGNSGLIKAAEKFDYTRGTRFLTMATRWITESISRAIADQARTIRLPIHVFENVGKYFRVIGELEQEKGREPTSEEIAEKLAIGVEEVIGLKRISRKTISLSEPVGEEGDVVLGDLIPDTEELSPDDVATKNLIREEVKKMLSTLPPREQRVLELRFGLEENKWYTLEEVGGEFGVTRERIRKIEQKALQKLRDYRRREGLKSQDYLD